MAIIKPFSEVTSAATTSDVTAANFPACQYAFTSDYGVDSTALTWTDRIAGMEAAASGSLTTDSNGALVSTGAPLATAVGAGIVSPGTESVVMIFIGYQGNVKHMMLGSSLTETGIGVAPKTDINYVVEDNDANYATVAAAHTGNIASSGTVGAFGLTVDFVAEEARSFNCTSAGVFTHNAAGAVMNSISNGVSTYDTDQMTLSLSGNAECYGQYILFFSSGLPGDVQAAVQWMVANPLKGLYPGWVGVE